MNKKQKIVFLIGLSIIVFMGLIPPWYFQTTFTVDQHTAFETDGGYEWIFDPPVSDQPWTPGSRSVVDLRRLLVQWGVVAIATAGLVFVLRDKS
jgi:hypothetical protein